jgi:type II secretory pathway pseudopilin PulG
MSTNDRRRPLATSRARRRGMTVVVVLVLVSIALAMSFAVMRSQTNDIQLQQNSDRGNLARQAAMVGLNAALRAMRLSTWGGVGTTLSAPISATDSYSVTFTAGDPSLTSSSPDYAQYPYRVTLVSRGTSADLAHPGVSTSYRAQAVVQLIPQQLCAVPSSWSTILNYTLYQLTNTEVDLALPCHVEGAVRLQSDVDVGSAYNWRTTPRARYFSDLNLMRFGVNEVQTLTRFNANGGTFTISFNGATTAPIAYNASSGTVQSALQNLGTIGSGRVSVASGGTGIWVVTFIGQLGLQNVAPLVVDSSGLSGAGALVWPQTTTPGGAAVGDYRQFSGPVNLPVSLTDSENQGLLSTQLGLSLNNISVSSTSLPVNSSLTYRLYPGGPTYNFGQLPASATNVTLSADPVANPLGVFYCSSNATLNNNVSVVGVLVTGGELVISGTNVNLIPATVLPISGSTTPIRLPTVVSLNNFRVLGGATAAVTGTMYVGRQFVVESGTEATSLGVVGNVIVGNDFLIRSRSEWSAYTNNQWDTFYSNFSLQLTLTNATPFFPKWLATNQGRNYVPQVTLRQDSTPVQPHWQDWSKPIYAIPSGANGLSWDLVSWTDRL